MSDAFIGEIRIFAGIFEPMGWMFCDGRMLDTTRYSVLYSVIGNMYGGDAAMFALPDLRGRIPIAQGIVHPIGQKGGFETVTLSAANLPEHTHQFLATTEGAIDNSPANKVLAAPSMNIYNPTPSNMVVMSGSSGLLTGSSQGHANVQPFLCLNFIISVEDGFWPA